MDVSMTTSPPHVRVVDRIELPSEEVDGWMDRWHREYVPAARERGMTLTGVGTRHSAPGHHLVEIGWELPGIYEFYGVRAANSADEVRGFWAATDALATSRDRQVFELQEAR